MNEPEHQTDSPNPASMSEFAMRSRQEFRGERQSANWVQLGFAIFVFIGGVRLHRRTDDFGQKRLRLSCI